MNTPCTTSGCTHSIAGRLSRKLALFTMLVLGGLSFTAWMSLKMMIVERTDCRKIQTTSAASSVPSSRCCFSEFTISRMNTASLETMLIRMPGGSCGSISLASFSLMRSTMATVLALVTLTTPMPIVVSPLKRASWRLSVSPSSSSARSASRIGEALGGVPR